MSPLTTSTSAGRKLSRASGGARSSRNALERDAILDTALGVLLDHGPQRMRLAELARRLGVVPSALHYHFPGGKDEVISALFDREESRALEAMARAVAGVECARDRMLSLATARLRNATRVARLYGAHGSHGETAHTNEIQDYVMQRRHGFLERERRVISSILHDAAGSRVSDNTIDLLAAAFQGALFNVTRTHALTASRKSGAILGELVDLFFVAVEERR